MSESDDRGQVNSVKAIDSMRCRLIPNVSGTDDWLVRFGLWVWRDHQTVSGTVNFQGSRVSEGFT